MSTIDLQDVLREERRKKARNKRFKRAVCREMNMESIRAMVRDMQDMTSEVAFASQNDDVLVDAFGGDEEEAFEFRAAFSTLENDFERFLEDLDECWVPECFDDFFSSIDGDNGDMMGFDAYESDYFGLDPGWETEAAIKEAAIRLQRMTKKDLIEAAHQCFRIAVQFLGLRSRYEDLEAALDILRAQNNGLLSAVKRINDLYDQADKNGFGEWDNDREREYNRLVHQLPDECWIR